MAVKSWTNEDLIRIIPMCTNWTEVLRSLGMKGSGSVARIQRAARECGIDTTHFVERSKRTVEISDDGLRIAVKSATNWSSLFSELGFSGRPGGEVQQRIRLQIKGLGLDSTHLNQRTGPGRKWTDDELTHAIVESTTWSEVACSISAGYRTCQKRARELGLDTAHLDCNDHMTPPVAARLDDPLTPDNLRNAAESLAAAWYTLHGYETFIPVSARAEDLDVRRGGVLTKIQVKTSTTQDGSGAWRVGLVHYRAGEPGRVCYSSGEVDEFFVVTLAGQLYRLPFDAVVGLGSVNLGRKYEKYRVEMFS